MDRLQAIPVSTRKPRDVDWPLLEGATALAAEPRLLQAGRGQRLLLWSRQLSPRATLLTSSFEALRGLKEILGLERVALFVQSRNGRWMQGVVGTSPQGELVDERDIRHEVHAEDVALYEDLFAGKRAFEVFDNAPLVEHDEKGTHVLGRGWLAKTAVMAGEQPFGLLYNDSAFSGAPFNQETQELIALFAELIAEPLRGARERSLRDVRAGSSSMVRECVELLHADPGRSNADLAKELGLRSNRLGRVFSKEMGESLLDYRNNLRLERFFELVDSAEQSGETPSLLDLALAAGFGSYSQFHRIFSARFGRSPRRLLDPE